MAKLQGTEFICLDVEATGLNTASDRVIEVAATRFTIDENLGDFESLINPECEIPAASQSVHNISQDMVKDKPVIAKVLPDLLAFIGTRTVVGHGIQYDIDILCNEAARCGISCSLKENPVIDTLRLARLYGESPANSLEVLRRHFNIQAEGAHRALADVTVNIQVFRHLSKRFTTTEQISACLARPILMKAMPLGKHKGRLLREVPLNYLTWAVRQQFDGDLLFSLQTELQRRRKGGGFHEASNPFHGL
jgi:DNA polymerase-3 subunit epsilon